MLDYFLIQNLCHGDAAQSPDLLRDVPQQSAL